MEQATATPDITLKENPIREVLHSPPDKRIEVTMTIRASDYPKLQAWMQSDTYERAEVIRQADLAECTKSLEHVVNYASREYGSAATVFAQFLSSLYNGNRVKADVSGIGSLDRSNFERLMNVLRLCKMAHQEPHSFFKNGNDIFEAIIKRHSLEKRRKS